MKLGLLKNIAERYMNHKVVFKVSHAELEDYKDKVAYTRKFCRQLITDQVLTPTVVKGTTRHRPKRVKILSRKEAWISRVRKLRLFLKARKATVSTKIHRKAYVLIKLSKINTKKKLETFLNENK